ncbi:MAG TPA: hypothetical protein VGN20_16935 [Mucilaginibacter sp.]
MKNHKNHIIRSWMLLACFIAGQFMIYTHQHYTVQTNNKIYNVTKNISKQTVKEKCYLCDVMHHNSMVITSQAFSNTIVETGHAFKKFEYDFKSIQLILSCGRAPPSSDFPV